MRIQLSEHFTYRKLLRFTLPSVIMMVCTSIYGVVDGVFVSNFVGSDAFAAVNLIMPFLMVLGAAGFMLGTGGSALVAYTLGAGSEKRANEIFSLLIYVLIVLVGFVAILSASYEEGAESIFSFSHFYMKQLVWMGISFAVAVVVLLVDASIYHKWAYLFYVLGLLTLVAALLFGREVNGAKAWFEIGSVRIQPVEFAKIATALALARVMSSSSFSINRAGDLFKVGLVICLPLLIIVMQNDTGSGIVLVSLLFVLYREGLNKWLCIPVILIAVLFIFSFLFTPLTLLVMLILVCTLSEAMMNGQWRSRMVYLAALALGTLLLYFGMLLAAPGALPARGDAAVAHLCGDLCLPRQSAQYFHYDRTVSDGNAFRSDYRLYFQFHPQRASAEPYFKFPGAGQ